MSWSVKPVTKEHTTPSNLMVILSMIYAMIVSLARVDSKDEETNSRLRIATKSTRVNRNTSRVNPKHHFWEVHLLQQIHADYIYIYNTRLVEL